MQETNPPPNILLIVADDIGYGDLSCHDGNIRTPHIDSLAKNGMFFLEGTVTAPQFAPSRTRLILGRSQLKFGFDYIGDDDLNCGLPVEERTMANFLQAGGIIRERFGRSRAKVVGPRTCNGSGTRQGCESTQRLQQSPFSPIIAALPAWRPDAACDVLLSK